MSYTPTPYRKRFIQFNKDGDLDLKDWRKVFVETCDPTEYTAAIQLVGSWEEWSRMKNTWPGFTEDILPEWLMEQEVYIRSAAIIKITTSDHTGDAKWLAEKRWMEKKPGKPTNVEMKRREKANELINDDISRVMGIHAVD